MRVYTLAKKLGVTSRELTAALKDMGLNKVAQSALSPKEINALIDAQAKQADSAEQGKPEPQEKPAKKATRKRAAKKTTKKKPASAEDEEKLRERVRKNVANEIHQLEEKVEAELAEAAESAQGTTDEPLEDITPNITPAPQASPSAKLAPVFVAPGEQDELDVEDLDEDDEPDNEQPHATKGSTRLEAKRRRRSEMREAGRRAKPIVSQAEFLARRESVERTMVVRERARHDGPGQITQVGVLEDDLLVEHFVTTEAQKSIIGNIYLGRVQNVLASMEAAFIDIGTGRNGVLYSSEVDWRSTGEGANRSRRIEQVLHSGDQVLVQVTKDPLGHKGPRLTTQISLAGRYLVYVPGGRSAGISRKLPGPERKRLKKILSNVIPGKGGAIIRTAAENVSEEAIATDVRRLHDTWEDIRTRSEQEKNSKGAKPVTLYEEPDMLVKVVRDLFNDDFSKLVVDGRRPWNTIQAYVHSVAPDLEDRLERYDGEGDAFEKYRIDEQIQKALAEKVWLPSGGHLIIQRTEAMVVIDVNTGKFTGSGGNLEETVTRNNLEAAEEIVRQMRLRDLGGMIVVDFIDMVLPENRDLVLRRLKEALGRDRTRHQVSEVTSLGLVQMTRKRLGTGLLETFSTPCKCCGGRGLILHDDPVDERDDEHPSERRRAKKQSRQRQREHDSEDKDSASLEEMAASVIADDSDEEPRPPKRSSRRRGRRGGSRGRGREREQEQEQEQERSEVGQIASEAVDRAKREDPDDHDESFEQAVADYENSPRRKRKTRGNSRSDHRPEKPEPEKPASSPRRRERRRAVRRSGGRASAPSRSEQRQQSQLEQPSQSKPQKSRGRRRAVRRATRRRS
ncbi:ribonuclease E [Corynebacterium yudongzhengii]|uniref:Ribonuclease E n=2 Tax=Corynebacterium yudongzhengii TaxID=2080740 RepID=A0A2U1T954_9CORY|nr:translation initiation factor IF-2 N-terminal domain-containing protein [Corynebacterium yudongzhengii]AWB83024.1 ribonuclease E [Corynebacterium yudongzhengii]PWC02523.1 ribonuclease E [Corynebacterium yudongzhengii]